MASRAAAAAAVEAANAFSVASARLTFRADAMLINLASAGPPATLFAADAVCAGVPPLPPETRRPERPCSAGTHSGRHVECERSRDRGLAAFDELCEGASLQVGRVCQLCNERRVPNECVDDAVRRMREGSGLSATRAAPPLVLGVAATCGGSGGSSSCAARHFDESPRRMGTLLASAVATAAGCGA